MNDVLDLQHFLPYRCNNLAEKISVSLSKIYTQEFGISIAEWRVLVTLANQPSLPAKQIAELTNMDKVRVSRAVNSLTDKQFLRRRQCESDSRAFLLNLSATGTRLYKRIAPQALAWEQSLVQPLTRNERKSLFQIIERLEMRLLEMKELAP